MDDEKLKTCETLFSICNSFGLRVLVERNIGMYIINYFKDKDRSDLLVKRDELVMVIKRNDNNDFNKAVLGFAIGL